MSPGTASTGIVLFTSNGTGLGHLSREIAIALAVGDRAPLAIFSLSAGLPLAALEGIRGEYCPSYSSPWIPRANWEGYLERRLTAFLDETRPGVVLFDGVAPYPGFMAALRRDPVPTVGWLRRGLWKTGASRRQLAKSSGFDFVIEPGELPGLIDGGPTANLEAIRTPPVSLFSEIEALDRSRAAHALGLDPDRPALLVTLGSGVVGEVSATAEAAIRAAIANPEWQICITRSPIAQQEMTDRYTDRVTPIEGIYPLIRYVRAFDAAVSSAGYNSVHELLPASMPTLFVPNSAAVTDDQEARARFLHERGLSLIAPDSDPGATADETNRLLDESVRTRLRAAMRNAQLQGAVAGASAVADVLLGNVPRKRRGPVDLRWVRPSPRRLAAAMLGDERADRVRRLMGRRPAAPQTRVHVVADRAPGAGETRLEVTTDAGAVAGARDHPVEHVIAGAGDSYLVARRRIIDDHYDVVG